MVVNAVSFVLGSTSLFLFFSSVSWWMALPMVASGCLCHRRWPVIPWFVAGFLLAAWHAEAVLNSRLGAEWLDREVTVVGVVAGLPDHDEQKSRFLLSLEQVCEVDSPACVNVSGVRVRMSWYRDAPTLKAGQRWRLNVKLRQPHGFMNPGGFDFEKWLFQQRIVATGYVRKSELAAQLGTRLTPSYLVQSMRIWLRQRLHQALQGRQHGGIVMAIAIGDRSGIERAEWQQFIITGTNHLLAISGLHISLVAGFVAMLAAFIWRRVARLHFISRYTFALLSGFSAALCYAGLAGFAVPTQRALLMFAVVALLSLIARHQARLLSLAIALLMVAASNPLVVLSAGFWMSFAAVAILFAVYSFIPLAGRRQQLLTVVRGHLLITLGLYPVGLLFFGHMSLISPVANFVATPLVGVVVTPMIFVASLLAMLSVEAAAIWLVPVDWLLSFLTLILSALSQWEYALQYVSFGHNPVLLWAAGIAALGLLPLNRSLRWLLPVVALPLFVSTSAGVKHGDYVVTMLDVGQGTAVVVQTKSHVLVYDTGAKYSRSFNAADAVILPYLRSAGIKAIDALMISHADNDHSGGAEPLLAGIAVEQVLVSAPVRTLPVSGLCRAGQHWRWDGVTFEVLHPASTDAGSKNDMSCVLMITSAGLKRTLLAGDIETRAEFNLTGRGLPQVDILLAPHHGSSTSSGVAFVSATRPLHVVHSAGFRNRYGFPHKSIVDAYRDIGAAQYETATSGAITFTVTADAGIHVSQYRLQSRRIWHYPLSENSN